MQTGRSVSSANAQIGSQKSVQNDGSPKGTGFSTKHNALAPLSTHRRISASANFGSHNWQMTIGTNIPGGPPGAHSSRMKSFHARTHASASSLSENCENSRPPNPGSDGKFTLASTPFASRSRARSFGSYEPGIMSENRAGSSPHCSR